LHFSSASTETLSFLCKRKVLICFIKLAENSSLDCLYSKLVCHMFSKAFSISTKNGSVDVLLLKLRVTSFVSPIHSNIGLWPALNAKHILYILYYTTKLYNIYLKSKLACIQQVSDYFSITFSNSLPVVDKRLIGLRVGEV
jgi:hypothetical protein